MKAVVTRVTSASVTIGGEVCGQIGRGFLVLLGVGPNDTEAQAARLADKVTGLRVFEDENEKMNRNLAAVGGGLLVVSQFTLYARLGFPPQHGRFGADMQVYSVNDGPVTILLDTDLM